MNFFKRSVDKLSKIYGDTIPSIFSIAFLFLIIFIVIPSLHKNAYWGFVITLNRLYTIFRKNASTNYA